jgi:hypothetical protein
LLQMVASDKHSSLLLKILKETKKYDYILPYFVASDK